MSDFDPVKAFNQAFDEELAAAPEGAEWLTSGRASKAYPNGEDETWWRTNGPEMVKRWALWRASIPWSTWVTPDGVLGVELELVLPIDGELYKLVIDNVFNAGAPTEPRLVVVDKKAGASEPQDMLQLGVYKTALELQWPGVPVVGGTYWMGRTGDITGVDPLNQYTPKYIGDLARRLRAIREARAFIPTVARHCRNCQVGQFCAVNNGRQSQLDPDWDLLNGRQ